MHLTAGAPGRLVQIENGASAFVPDPLPPDIEANWELADLIGEANRALGALEAAGSTLANPNLIAAPLLNREAVLSSRIEGTVTSLEQLALFEASPEDAPAPLDARVVGNYVIAARYGLDRLQNLPVSLRLVREVHERLFEGVDGQVSAPGEFRGIQNYIGSRARDIKSARFVPPPPAQVLPALRQLEKYMGQPQSLPPLVELALTHYQFEAIHPFEDGNGRVGRILIKLLMRQRGILTHPLLSLSAYFHEHRDAYVDHLLFVSERGDWVPWIRYFIIGVVDQARDSGDRAKRLLGLREDYRERLQAESRSVADLRLLDMLFERPATTIPGAAKQLEVSRPTARTGVNRLIAAGILEEATTRPRNRIYVAPGIIELMQVSKLPDQN